MTLKTHFASSPDPFQEGSTVRAWCSQDVPRVLFVVEYQGAFPATFQKLIEEIKSSIGLCKNCRKVMEAQSEIPADGRYFYAIRTREEAAA